MPLFLQLGFSYCISLSLSLSASLPPRLSLSPNLRTDDILFLLTPDLLNPVRSHYIECALRVAKNKGQYFNNFCCINHMYDSKDPDT